MSYLICDILFVTGPEPPPPTHTHIPDLAGRAQREGSRVWRSYSTEQPRSDGRIRLMRTEL